MNFEKFSERLNYALKVRMKENQTWLHEQTGISMGLISNYCLAKDEPTASKALNIAEALKVSYEWLYAGIGEIGTFDSTKIYQNIYQHEGDDKDVTFKLKKSPRKSLTFSFTFSRKQLSQMLPKLVDMMSS
jgi:transcriptional regulator with XRE-family HTH domain